MSPHSQLLIAAATIGAVVVLAIGILLGSPYGLPGADAGTDPTLTRVTVLDITPEAGTTSGNDSSR